MEPKKGNSISIRNLALDVLIQVMEEGAYCDKALHNMLENHSDLEKRDRAFLNRLCQGTIEYSIQLDYVLDQYSKIKTRKMKPVIRNILRMGVYQLLYMEQVPDSAACNESVKLAVKRHFQNLRGFVNGVMRSISREKDKISWPQKDKNYPEYIQVMYSMPLWLVNYFGETYGYEETEKIAASFLEKDRYTSLRINQSKVSKESVVNSLKQQQVEVSDGKLLPMALLIQGYNRLWDLEVFQQGLVQVQDESSMMVGQIASIQKEQKIIDVCAAPGGKTIHAADLLGGTGKVISCDLTQSKVLKISENIDRIGFENIELHQNDALVLRKEWIETADLVIADLPCSGLGVIGKKCDIKYKTKREDITELAEIQRKILKVVSQYVKPGGTLLFSTCTMAAEENQENAKWIVQNLPFQFLSFEELLPEVMQGKGGKMGYLQVLPTMAGTDGFFLAKFIKTIDK